MILSFTIAAQSTDQNFPSPVSTNEIVGQIKVRDVGDSRLTSHYYAFDGGQGDIFINAVTKNFNGSIDVFATDGLKPLTKMVIYADSGSNETGRLVYLRKPERLLLRVEGRSPNDDPATYTIKIGGSFIALNSGKPEDAPKIVGEKKENEPGTYVNSVGTIIKVVPKPEPVKIVPEAKPETAKVKEIKPEKKSEKAVTARTEQSKKKAETEKKKPADEKIKPPATTVETPVETTAGIPAGTTVEPPTATKVETPAKPTARKTATKKPAKVTKQVAKEKKPVVVPTEKTPDPLASIRLVIELKDGTTFWRPMNEVIKFNLDKGVYTVIAKDGTISRYSILDVAKITIQ